MTRDRSASDQFEGDRFDYVIVGAGSAGCVLAARLSEDPGRTVLLLEAGGSDAVDEIRIPAALHRTFRTRLDWNYRTEPQTTADGRRVRWPRGRVLGGSSSINAMIYMRGNAADYDEWAALGNQGWSYQDVLEIFRRAEDNSRGADAFHGTGGPLRVSDQRSPHPWSAAFVEAAVAAGHPRNPDFNGPAQDGAGLFQVTQHRGRRWSAADAYLHPAENRPNLVVRTNALATQVELTNGRATGVRYRWNGATRTAYADAEVLLAGGAVNSPQLLLLSGVGDPDQLRAVGVQVQHALTGVGLGLQDHPVFPVVFTTRAGGSLMDAESPRNLARWRLFGRGPLTSNVAEAGLFCRSHPELALPDLQFHVTPVKFWENAVVEPDFHALTLGVVLVRVASQGTIRLRSADPTHQPAVDPGYLREEVDLNAITAGIGIAREIAASGPLRDIVSAEWHPGETARSPEALRRAVRARLETLYHPVSSCRMGSDELAVVDDQLRVHGLTGLRVVDASVLPTLVRGNTHAPTVMVAERAAELIRSD